MAIQALEMTWGERLREEGREEGRAAGVLETKRDMLLDALRTRFGAVPEGLKATIAQADDAWLSQMHHRAILAGGLEELID
jgi:hypothetical protein